MEYIKPYTRHLFVLRILAKHPWKSQANKNDLTLTPSAPFTILCWYERRTSL